MNDVQRFFEVNPSGLVFEFLPNKTFYGMLTKLICELTGKTTDELGLAENGHNMFFDTKDSAIRVLSKFDTRQIERSGSGFGNHGLRFIPEMDNLHGYLYYGDLAGYVYDYDEKAHEVTIEWHTDILFAYLADISLLDPGFKITQKPIERQKTDKKKTAVASAIKVHVNLDSKGNYEGFKMEEIDQFIENLG